MPLKARYVRFEKNSIPCAIFRSRFVQIVYRAYAHCGRSALVFPLSHNLFASRAASCWRACFSRMLLTNAGRISCKRVCVIRGTRRTGGNGGNFTLNPSSRIYKSHRVEVALLTQICGICDRSSYRRFNIF